MDLTLLKSVWIVVKPSGRKSKIHADSLKYFDPLNQQDDCKVKLLKEDDVDVDPSDVLPDQEVQEIHSVAQAFDEKCTA